MILLICLYAPLMTLNQVKYSGFGILVTTKVEKFLVSGCPNTPCLVVDLDVVSMNYKRFKEAFPGSMIYYAVKANPAPPILKKLAALGSRFDAASLLEVERCLAVGVVSQHISYGNTIKKVDDIAATYDLGVRLFAFDSEHDLQKINIAAPGSKVFCRIMTKNTGAAWPFSDKFGCSPDMAIDLLIDAEKMGLEPHGVSFHVGSQQTNAREWGKALKCIALLFNKLRKHGINLDLLNLGGGFPISYRKDVLAIEVLASSIQEYIAQYFSDRLPTIMFEPGRYIIAEAGLLRSEVVLVSTKSYGAKRRWIYLDVGTYGGLAETMNEAIQYPLRTLRDGSEKGPVIIAGPSCDGADVLYRNAGYELPLTLKAGDFVDILCTGAYTASYASIDFNGFAPLQEYYL